MFVCLHMRISEAAHDSHPWCCFCLLSSLSAPPFCPSRPAVDKLLDSPVTLSSKILFYFWRVGGEEQMDDRLLYKLFNKCIYFIAGEKHLIACLLA